MKALLDSGVNQQATAKVSIVVPFGSKGHADVSDIAARLVQNGKVLTVYDLIKQNRKNYTVAAGLGVPPPEYLKDEIKQLIEAFQLK